MNGIGLYLHIPFCAAKCAYCDFASYAGMETMAQPILDAMEQEMARAAGLAIATAYVGGGTPTVLPGEMLAGLLRAARRHFTFLPDAEITVEANPGTVDEKKLALLRKAGVNRLSFGAQAMQENLLKTLGRIHRWQDVEKAVSMAKAAGFENLSLDLMYGLPGQRPMDFRDSLSAALSLGPTHLSLYSLIIEPGTPFHSQYGDRPDLLPGEDALSQMADDALWMTADAGLARYEISSYAKPGYESRHNLGYWLRRDYIGIGPAAHSLLRNFRWGNDSTLPGYLAGKREEEMQVSETEARFERLMLGLRLTEGIPWGEQALYDTYRDAFEKLRARGLMEWDDTHLWLTARGLDLQNRVMVELMG